MQERQAERSRDRRRVRPRHPRRRRGHRLRGAPRRAANGAPQQLDELAGMEPMLATLADLPGCPGHPRRSASPCPPGPSPRLRGPAGRRGRGQRRAAKRRRSIYMVAAAAALIIGGPTVARRGRPADDTGSEPGRPTPQPPAPPRTPSSTTWPRRSGDRPDHQGQRDRRHGDEGLGHPHRPGAEERQGPAEVQPDRRRQERRARRPSPPGPSRSGATASRTPRPSWPRTRSTSTAARR